MSEYCEDCGCKVHNGLCENCDEETFIFRQDLENEEHVEFSKDFKEKLNEQYKKRKII